MDDIVTRDILDHQGNVIGELSLPSGTSEEEWATRLAEYSAPPPAISYEEVVRRARIFGDSLSVRFSAENIAMGITQAGLTGVVADYLQKLGYYLSSGSLYQALAEIERIKADSERPEMSPFVTNDRMDIYAALIRGYLGI